MIGYKGWRIPEGNVVQVTDASGVVLWKLETSEPTILEVAKITSDTYAGETTYTGEQFILLDIYPESVSSVVNITYGGLTKTLTFSGTNAKQVFFGTFNGVSDSVSTPSSGTLVIEGGCKSVGIGSYKTYANDKTSTEYFTGVTAITAYGANTVHDGAFENCNIISATFTGVDSIGKSVVTSNSIKDLNVTVNGLPKYMPRFAFRASINTNSSLSIKIIDESFDWDKWVDVKDSRPATETIEHTSTGGTDKEDVKVYINGVITTDISSVELKECKTICSYAFYWFNLTSITIPSSVTSIGDEVCVGCSNLTSVSIPSSVTSIGDYAFWNYNTSNITMLATNPPTLGEKNPFYSSDKLIITVPVGYGETYKTAEGWSRYADYIVEAS